VEDIALVDLVLGLIIVLVGDIKGTIPEKKDEVVVRYDLS
jgi:hypothetical protein